MAAVARTLMFALVAVMVLTWRVPVVAADPCTFRLGFKALHDLIPDVVGHCAGDETHNPQNGDGLQQTTNGLLVWRKADNWTAFTDGTTTWINGPEGLQSRPNDQRFPWEADASARPAPTTASVATGTLTGQVSIGPLTPVERADEPAPTPSAAVCTARSLRVAPAGGAGPSSTVPLAPDCTYSVVLAPGSYVVDLGGAGIDSSPDLPQTVEIAAGQTERLDIRIDTGIR